MNNFPPFRAKQLYHWMYRHGINETNEMNNIPKEMSELLSQEYQFKTLQVEEIQSSEKENTKKILFKTHDNRLIESVSMIDKNLHTICISSQVGCSVDCQFCATGEMGFMRSLSCGEIIDQFIEITKIREEPITNVVYMGMGEPLLNFSNLISSIDKISSKNGLSISTKRITVSTVGVPKIIKKMADMNVNFNLAVSLHSAIQKKREMVMPFSNKIDLDELSKMALKDPSTSGNPKKLSLEDIKKLYEFSIEGKTFE